jgi:23S rRNA pseudouridine2605 synthase
MSDGATRERQAAAARKGERVAKAIARAGLCSRRDAERLIADGRVTVNGHRLETPATLVGPEDRIEVDGEPLEARERTRLWLFHKPKGLVTTNRDPEGRPTIFSVLPALLPRVMTVGRLDINSEGLLLLTNDGGLARVLELPATGWLRRYRVRAHGRIEQPALDALRHGVTIDGIVYGAIEAEIDRLQGANIWLTVGLREGKNREVRRVLEHLGLAVNRLIRISYGPFQLGELQPGEVREIRGRTLRDQLGAKLARAAKADFDAPLRPAEPPPTAPGAKRRAKPHAHRRRQV